MTGVVTLTGWLVVNSDLECAREDEDEGEDEGEVEVEVEVEVEDGGRKLDRLGKYIMASW